jgi:hypothetical protein
LEHAHVDQSVLKTCGLMLSYEKRGKIDFESRFENFKKCQAFPILKSKNGFIPAAISTFEIIYRHMTISYSIMNSIPYGSSIVPCKKKSDKHWLNTTVLY